MPKWFYGEYGGVNVDDGDYYEEVEHLGDALRLHNSDIDALTARAEAAERERDELRRRIDAVLAMLHLSSSTIHDNWVGYCSACWWRGDARCADWTEDSSGGMQPECPICGESVDEHPSYTHSVVFYEHAMDIAEGRNHE